MLYMGYAHIDFVKTENSLEVSLLSKEQTGCLQYLGGAGHHATEYTGCLDLHDPKDGLQPGLSIFANAIQHLWCLSFVGNSACQSKHGKWSSPEYHRLEIMSSKEKMDVTIVFCLVSAVSTHGL